MYIPPTFVLFAINKMLSIIIPLNNYSLDEDDHPINVYSTYLCSPGDKK